MTWFVDLISQTAVPVQITISIAIMLVFGFLISRLTKLIKLPNVTGYILAGIIIGPYLLNLIPKDIIGGLDFISDIAIAIIAFSIGEYFKFDLIKKNGLKILVITLFEIVLTSVAVFVVTYFVLQLNLIFAVLLSALASATAPAAIITIVKHYKAKGEFVDTLLQTVALDNIIGIFAFSIVLSLSLISIGETVEQVSALTIILPIIKNIGAIVVGVLVGFLLKWIFSKKQSNQSRLLIVLITLFIFTAICLALDISSLIGCMVIGTVYANLTNDTKLFGQLNDFSPPILLLFFVKGGLALNFAALFSSIGSVSSVAIWVICIVYFFARAFGKYLGAFLGCLTVKKPKAVSCYLGLAILPQASIAIALATFASRVIGGVYGEALITIVVASSVLNEIIGPVLTKLSLHLSKSYDKQDTQNNMPSQEEVKAEPETEVNV